MLRDALTIPNAVSFVRVLAVPYFWWVLLAEDRVGLAAALIFIIGSTDWIDGYLARRLDQVSEVGKFLDPLADRLMIASALVAGLIAEVLPLAIGVPLLLREVVIGAGALWFGARYGSKLDVRRLGKISTFLLYGALPSFYLDAADFLPWAFGSAAWIAGVVGLLLYYRVAFDYLADMRALVAADAT